MSTLRWLTPQIGWFGRRVVLGWLLALFVARSALGKEPPTRTTARRAPRKPVRYVALGPPGLERILRAFEGGRVSKRVLNPSEGLYLQRGTITSGSGFVAGRPYRHGELSGGSADFRAFAAQH
jgi:hypothetical protein